MTKDGRPSRITDIRYFCGNPHTYLEGCPEAVAFGRRLAWFLNGEAFSLGAYEALYLFLSPSLATGTTHITDHGGDWWQRYTHVGVPPGFPDRSDADEIAMQGAIQALLAIRPDQSDLIRAAAGQVRAQGERLRFLLKRHSTRGANHRNFIFDRRVAIALASACRDRQTKWRSP